MPRSSRSRLCSTLARAAGLPENVKSSSRSLEEGQAAAVDSPRRVKQQPADATAQLHSQLLKTLRDALDEMRTMHRMSEEARQRERDQLHERIHELTDKEERGIAEVGGPKVKIAELVSKLLGGQQADAAGRRIPLSTEIQRGAYPIPNRQRLGSPGLAYTLADNGAPYEPQGCVEGEGPPEIPPGSVPGRAATSLVGIRSTVRADAGPSDTAASRV